MIPGSGRSPEEGHGNPLQYPCLENPMDRGAWRARGLGVTKNLTLLPLLERFVAASSSSADISRGRKLASRTFLRPFTRASRNFHLLSTHSQATANKEHSFGLSLLYFLLQGSLSILVLSETHALVSLGSPCQEEGTTSPDALRCLYTHHAVSVANPLLHRDLILTEFLELFHIIYCFSLNPLLSMILLCQV